MTPEQKRDIIKDFLIFCKDYLEIDTLPKVELITDENWAKTMTSFGMYDPRIDTLFVYIGKRNLADILRTISHELVHHKQNEKKILYLGAGKEGTDIENEANSISGMIMRKYGAKNNMIYESKLSAILEMSNATRFNIFCDMDGVLCDFEAQFDHYYGVTPSEYRKEKGAAIMKNAIDDIGIDFWSKMPWFPGGQRLWSYISNYNANILSSPSNFKYAVQGKLLWIKNNLNPKPQKILFEQSGNKQNVLSGLSRDKIKTSILIDDFYTNVKPWQESGGIGITHKDIVKTISILQKFGL